MTRRLLNLLGKILKEIRRMGREREGQELLTVKENGIQTSFVKRCRPSQGKKNQDYVRQELARVRSTAMEGAFGTQKEHYAMRWIRARKKETEILYIFFGIHTANAVCLAERLSEGREAEAA